MLTGCMSLFTFNSILHTPCSALAANLRKVNQPGHTEMCIIGHVTGAHTARHSSADDVKHGLFIIDLFLLVSQSSKIAPSPIRERAGLPCPSWKCVNEALTFTKPKENSILVSSLEVDEVVSP